MRWSNKNGISMISSFIESILGFVGARKDLVKERRLSSEHWVDKNRVEWLLLKCDYEKNWTPRNMYCLLPWGWSSPHSFLKVSASQQLVDPQKMQILSCWGYKGTCSPQVKTSLCNAIILLSFLCHCYL